MIKHFTGNAWWRITVNDEELTEMLKELVEAAVTIAQNVESIAKVLERVEEGEQ